MKLGFVVMCIPLLLLNACVTRNPASNTAGNGNDDANARSLPVFKPYTGADGGFVAVYTHDREQAVYSVGDDIYVAGLVRVQGHYIGRIFYPTGYGPGDDITHDAAILKLCDRYFPQLKGRDWIGGDTGGFVGGDAEEGGAG